MKNQKKILLIILIVIGIIGIITFWNKKTIPKQNAVNTNIPSVTISPSTNQTNEDIWKTIKMKSTGISPLLYPEKLPTGLQSQKIIQSVPGAFFVEYSFANKKLLHLGVDEFNPGEIDAKGSQNQVTVRGQKGTLQMTTGGLISLWWQEPGTWKPTSGQNSLLPIKNYVFYMISAEGFTPQEIQDFAESLKPLN